MAAINAFGGHLGVFRELTSDEGRAWLAPSREWWLPCGRRHQGRWPA